MAKTSSPSKMSPSRIAPAMDGEGAFVGDPEAFSDTRSKVLGRSHRSPSKTNLMAWYPLDYNTNDFSGNNRHSVSETNIIFNAGGSINNAAYFNGSTSVIQLPNTIINESIGTILVRFYHDDTPDDEEHVFDYFEGSTKLWITVESNNSSYIWWGADNKFVQTTYVAPAQWHTIVVTWDDTYFYAYLDGTYQGSDEIGTVSIGSNVVRLGNSAFPYQYDGRIDDVITYSRILTPQEIEFSTSGSVMSDTAVYQSDLKVNLVSWDKLYAHYPLDSNTDDIWGGYDCTTDPFTYTTGKVGNAAVSISTSNGATMPVLGSFSAITVMLWLKADSSTFGSDVMALQIHNDTGGNSGNISITKDLNENLVWQISTTSGSQNNWITSFQLNTWYHIAVTWDGSTIRYYVNGNDIGGADSLAGIMDFTTYGTAGAKIGAQFTSFADWIGLLDDVRIYDVGLSASEISAIYLDGSLGSISAVYQAAWDTKTKTSDSLIIKIGEISRVSDTTVFQVGWDTKDIDTESAIFRASYGLIDALSDTRIKVISFDEKDRSSLTRIKNIYQKDKDTDSAIFRASYGLIDETSTARIVKEGTIVIPPVYSDSTISLLTEITKLSDTWVRLPFERPSDTAIHRIGGYGLVDKISDTAIFRTGYDTKSKLSDTAIYRTQVDKQKISETRIKREGGYTYPFQKAKASSDTRIITTFLSDLLSRARIKIFDNELIKLSDTLVMYFPQLDKISDTVIRVPDNTLESIRSRTKIKTPFILDKLSDSIINLTSKPTKVSDTFIILNLNIFKTSDTAIYKSGLEFLKLSDTLIKDITDIPKSSDAAIFRSSYNIIEKRSHTAIQILSNKVTKVSDSRALRTFSTIKISDTLIRRDRSNLRAIFQKSRQL